MGFFFRQFGMDSLRRNRFSVLAFTWVFAIIFGVVISGFNSDFMTSLMHDAVFSRISFLGILSGSVLPLLFSAFVMDSLGDRFLTPLVFICGFFQGFFGWGVMAAFGSPGWLVRPLLLFSNFWMTPLLWFFWVRYLRTEAVRYFPLFLLTGFGVSWIDFSFVSPFLTEILSL